MILSIQQIALAHLSRQDLTILNAKTEIRPERTAALGIDFYHPGHIRKPLDKARFCVARFEWRKGRWRRVYKYGGPKQLDQAQEALVDQARRFGLPIINQA